MGRFLISLLVAMSIAGCGAEDGSSEEKKTGTDDGQPTMAEYMDQAVDSACMDALECGREDTCAGDMEEFLAYRWTEETCEQKIDEERFTRCVEELIYAACGGLMDLVPAQVACDATRVCIGE